MKKVTILHKPGTYGHYLGQFVLEMITGNPTKYTVDSRGSMHNFRFAEARSKIINIAHSPDYVRSDLVIAIDPDPMHAVDYLSNQLSKNFGYRLRWHFEELFGGGVIEEKVRDNYGIEVEKFDDIPRWTLREITSYCIPDLTNDLTQPFKIDGLHVSATEIITNFNSVLDQVASYLGLDSIQPNADICNDYLQKQVFFNSQQRCKEWVEQVINRQQADAPILTLFEESYIQHLLREKGFELQCSGLDQFPSNTTDLRKVIYENS